MSVYHQLTMVAPSGSTFFVGKVGLWDDAQRVLKAMMDAWGFEAQVRGGAISLPDNILESNEGPVVGERWQYRIGSPYQLESGFVGELIIETREADRW